MAAGAITIETARVKAERALRMVLPNSTLVTAHIYDTGIVIANQRIESKRLQSSMIANCMQLYAETT